MGAIGVIEPAQVHVGGFVNRGPASDGRILRPLPLHSEPLRRSLNLFMKRRVLLVQLRRRGRSRRVA